MDYASSVFDYEIPLPDEHLAQQELSLLGFEIRYDRIQKQLQLLLRLDEVNAWSKSHYGKKIIPLCNLISEQYPLVVFHGDVGTGKTVTAECVANRLVRDAKAEDSILFKLSNRVRGSGKVGEMGTLLADAFKRITEAAGKARRAILIIDEGDSLAATRTQEHSHHEDKVAVNTLIQSIDSLRTFGGRVVTILCTNRLSVVDAALRRRASIVEEFVRPSPQERRQLFSMDLDGLGLHSSQVDELVQLTGERDGHPTWTYSDLRSRFYPIALSKAFPDRPLSFEDLRDCASTMQPTPIMEDI
ncbi:MAG: AAA family ATPase [Gammaproteobacteria bacterium]